jgi:hypothetical protein
VSEAKSPGGASTLKLGAKRLEVDDDKEDLSGWLLEINTAQASQAVPRSPTWRTIFFKTATEANAKQVPVWDHVELRVPIHMVRATRLDIVVHGTFAQMTTTGGLRDRINRACLR